MTLLSTESAMSSISHTPRPAMTRSWNMYTPGRASVTPSRRSVKVIVGVEPTLTTGAGNPAARKVSAAPTAQRRGRTIREHTADRDERIVIGCDAGARTVAVDLDQHGEAHAERCAAL